jgi:outer membrane receptor protein involved in Fe transport
MKRVIIINLVLILGFTWSTVIAQEQATLKTEDLFQMSLEEFLNVSIVTSSKMEEKILETPATVNVITEEEIKTLNFNTLEQLLEYSVGMSSVNGEGNFYTATSIRGNTVVNYNVNTLFLFDGKPLYNPFNGSFELNVIPLNAIDRIEIVKGSNSVLYGTNAISAVINIISKKTKEGKDESQVKVKYGSKQTMYAQGTLLKNYDQFHIRLFTDVNTSKGEDLTINDELGHTEIYRDYYKGANIAAKIDYKDFSFSFQYYNRQQPNMKTRGFDYDLYILNSDTFKIVVPERHDEFGVVSSLEFDHKFSDKIQLRMSTNYWYWDLRKNEFAGYWDCTSKSFFNEAELVIKPVPWISNIIGVSSNYMFARRYESEINTYDVGLDNKWTTDAAVYLNGTIDISKSLKFSYGGRYYLSSYKDTTLTNLSPRFALVYNIFKNTYLKIIYGKSFRVPTYFEKEVASSKIKGNPYLLPEKSASLDLVIASIYKGVQYNIDFFNLEIQNQIGRHFIDNKKTISQNYNTSGKSVYTGVELDTKFRLMKKLIGFAGYSYVNGKNVQKDTTTYLKFTYHNMVNFGCDYQILNRISVSTSLKYLDKWGEAKSYLLWNGGLNISLTDDSKAELEFKVDNILKTNVLLPEISRDKPQVPTIPFTSIRKVSIGIYCYF